MLVSDYVLSPGAWQALVNTHPELNVQLVANGEPISSLCILCPVLPLTCLVWDEGLCFTSEQEVEQKLYCNFFLIYISNLVNYLAKKKKLN